jgi:hypothetical protein
MTAGMFRKTRKASNGASDSDLVICSWRTAISAHASTWAGPGGGPDCHALEIDSDQKRRSHGFGAFTICVTEARIVWFAFFSSRLTCYISAGLKRGHAREADAVYDKLVSQTGFVVESYVVLDEFKIEALAIKGRRHSSWRSLSRKSYRE